MDWAQNTAQALLKAGNVDRAALRGQGYPTSQDQIETNYWENFDTLAYPEAVLSTFSQEHLLFTEQTGSGLARNYSLPSTSDIAFFNYRILAYLTVRLENNTDQVPMTPVDGQSLLEAARILAQATKIKIEVALKTYLTTTLDHFTNYQIPIIVDSVAGQVAPAPMAVSGGSWNQHHRASLALDPGIIWPANGQIGITIQTNVAAWARDVYGTAVDLTVNPYTIKMTPTWKFVFLGTQARVVK